MLIGGEAALLAMAFLILILTSLSSVSMVTAFNITNILKPYPEFSQLNSWLSRTGVADEINNRTSLTILAPSNTVLQGYIANVSNDPNQVGDVLRYHVLLTYFGLTELSQLPENGTSVTTLLQTTGRANESQGFVTLYNNGTSYLVAHEYLDSFGNETILGDVVQSPYDYSVLQVSSILLPAPPSLPTPVLPPNPARKLSPPPAATDSNGTDVSGTETTDSSDARSGGAVKGLLFGTLVASVAALI